MSWFVYALLSAISYSFFTIFSKMGTKDIDPVLAATIYFVVSSSFLIMLCFYFDKFPAAQMNSLKNNGFSYIILASIANGLSWVFYLVALRDVSAAKASSVDLMSYFFTAMLGVLLLGEVFQFKYIVGAVLISLGAALF